MSSYQESIQKLLEALGNYLDLFTEDPNLLVVSSKMPIDPFALIVSNSLSKLTAAYKDVKEDMVK
jgi:hypothetical protein